MKGFYKNSKLQLQTTNYLKNMHFPTHDYASQQEEQIFSNNSLDQNSQNTQVSDYEDAQDINEQVTANMPKFAKGFHLISSLFVTKSHNKRNLIKIIDENKSKYNDLLKKKQENRQKFIQKINKHMNDSQSNFLSFQNPSKKHLNVQKSKKKSIKLKNHENQIKIPRSQTQEHKQKKNGLDIKYAESYWDKASSIDFNQTKSRIQSEFQDCKKSQKQQKRQIYRSEKKKITIKRKGSVSLSVKQNIQQNKAIHEHQNQEMDKKVQKMDKSMNEFHFFGQYQKDNKEIMNRLLTIIEQNHINRAVSNGSRASQSISRENPHQMEQVNRILTNNTGVSEKNCFHQIQTEYSSVKPIVINNYIKSPTGFMGKQFFERQMTIKMLEQNRHNKRSYLNSIVDSRMLHQSTIIGIPSRRNSESKQQADKKHQESTQEFQKKQKGEQILKHNKKVENELDFQLLYKKLINQVQTQKNNSKPERESESQKVIPQRNTQQASKPSQLLLPINSSREQISGLPSSSGTDKKTLDSHNLSQNLTEFNFNSQIQSQNFKKPSISMEIQFENNKQIQPRQNLSLAEAFKKKFGARKKFGSNGKSITKDQQQLKVTVKPRQALSELKDYQKNASNNKININQETFNEKQLKKQIPSARKTIKMSKKPVPKSLKQNINTLLTPRNDSQHFNSITQSSAITKMSRQPSKQLLDRLIYGQKATMTKKQMYELSKKNYMKLPEIQEKRKQEQKRLKQLQKREKIKQYQKRIRSGKNSVAKDSAMASLQTSMIRQMND